MEEAKRKLEYAKNHLTAELRNRFEKIFSTLEDWRKEGEKIENESKEIYKDNNKRFLEAGAYARYDDGIDPKKSIENKIDFPSRKYNEAYDCLDKSFKSASWLSLRIGKGIEMLYDLMANNKEQFEKEAKNLDYLNRHKEELSKEEKKILEDKSKGILDAIELMESVYKIPKGVYLSEPPLHAGSRGEDAKNWSPRSYILRDMVFYETKSAGKENFTNTKEYHLAKGGDDLKIRLYSFSSEPDQKKLGELGMALEIERNGQKKFLNDEEAEELLKNLANYTLPTLYLKNHTLLSVKKK